MGEGGPKGRMRGVERSETAPYVQHARFAIERHTMAREIPKSLLIRFARKQRANAVRAEAIIWHAVRNRRCEGAKFQRQVPFGEYIVDFVCFESRLSLKSTARATMPRSSALQTRSAIFGWERRGFGFFGYPTSLSSLQRNWRWPGYVVRLDAEQHGTEPSRSARPPSSVIASQ